MSITRSAESRGNGWAETRTICRPVIATSPTYAGSPEPFTIRAFVRRMSYGVIVRPLGRGMAPVRAAITRSSSAKYCASETLGLLGARGIVLCATTMSSLGITVMYCPIAPNPE